MVFIVARNSEKLNICPRDVSNERQLIETDTGIFCSIPQSRKIKYILTNVFLTVENDYDSPECFLEGLPGQNLKKLNFAYFGVIFEVFWLFKPVELIEKKTKSWLLIN